MRRAALLLCFGAAPLVLVLFPSVRRFVVRKARLLLLILTGAILLGGLSTLAFGPRLGQLSAIETGLTVAGIAVLLGSFLAVVRDGARDRRGNFPPR